MQSWHLKKALTVKNQNKTRVKVGSVYLLAKICFNWGSWDVFTFMPLGDLQITSWITDHFHIMDY